MGVAKRLRIDRILSGEEMPRNASESGRIVPEKRRFNSVLTCRFCGNSILTENAREHIKKCWKVELRTDEPIPMLPTRDAILKWIARR